VSDQEEPSDESAWIARLNAFQHREVAGFDPANGLSYWSGVVERFEAFVGPPPTPQAEQIRELVVPAYERIETAGRDNDLDGIIAAAEQLVRASEDVLALVGGEPVPPAPKAASPYRFELPAAAEVELASITNVTRKRIGSYGNQGVLLLSPGKLTFITRDNAACWQLALRDIDDLKRPRYGMGSLVTCTVGGAFYAFVFKGDAIDLPSLTAASGLALRFGGAAGGAIGIAGEVVAVSKMASRAKLGARWFALLGRSTA
jgi:hypothetical protein